METGWLIERKMGDIPIWWNGLPKRFGAQAWSVNSLDGIRFANKVYAETCAIAQGYSLSNVKATEHQWG